MLNKCTLKMRFFFQWSQKAKNVNFPSYVKWGFAPRSSILKQLHDISLFNNQMIIAIKKTFITFLICNEKKGGK